MVAAVTVVATFVVCVLRRLSVLSWVAMGVDAACALDATNHPKEGRFALAPSCFHSLGIVEGNWSLQVRMS